MQVSPLGLIGLVRCLQQEAGWWGKRYLYMCRKGNTYNAITLESRKIIDCSE
jgi:hypothetical protein